MTSEEAINMLCGFIMTGERLTFTYDEDDGYHAHYQFYHGAIEQVLDVHADASDWDKLMNMLGDAVDAADNDPYGID